MKTRAERRRQDRRAKARVRFVWEKVWQSGKLTARQLGRHASIHLCTGRHRWCCCTASSLRRMGYVTRQETRAASE